MKKALFWTVAVMIFLLILWGYMEVIIYIDPFSGRSFNDLQGINRLLYAAFLFIIVAVGYGIGTVYGTAVMALNRKWFPQKDLLQFFEESRRLNEDKY